MTEPRQSRLSCLGALVTSGVSAYIATELADTGLTFLSIWFGGVSVALGVLSLAIALASVSMGAE